MRQGFSFLICPDSALLKEELERLASAALKDGGNWRKVTFWGDEEPGEPFWETLSQGGLFADKRFVIVRQAENWSAQIWKDVSGALSRELEHSWPFFCLECAWEKGKPKIPAHIQKARCFGFAEKKRWVWKSPGLGANLAKFARDQAQKLGLEIGQRELNIFCETVAPNASAVTNELKKLALFAKDGKISSDLLDGGATAKESDAFALARNLMSGDLDAVWRQASADSEGALLFLSVATLARELRVLWQLAFGENPWIHPSEAARKRALAKALGPVGIGKGFSMLADAEWQVKSGRQTPAQALETLCAAMSGLFRKA